MYVYTVFKISVLEINTTTKYEYSTTLYLLLVFKCSSIVDVFPKEPNGVRVNMFAGLKKVTSEHDTPARCSPT